MLTIQIYPRALNSALQQIKLNNVTSLRVEDGYYYIDAEDVKNLRLKIEYFEIFVTDNYNEEEFFEKDYECEGQLW